MSGSTRVRPKFKLQSDISTEGILKEVSSLLHISTNVEGKIVDNYIYLKIPEKDQHYWSPEMRVSIKDSNNGSLVSAMVGPNGKVWATFMVYYGLSVMVLLFGGSFGISQWFLGIESFWIWSIPLSVLMYVTIILAARYGQRLGKEQHLTLRYFLNEAIAHAENRSS